MFIGKRGLNQGHVYGNQLRSEEIGNSGEKDRRVVCSAAIDGISGAVAYKERVEPKVLLQLFIGIGRHTQRPDVDQLSIEECLGMVLDIVNQSGNQVLGLAAARADEDSISGMDVRKYALLRNEFLRIDILKLFQQSLVFHLNSYSTQNPLRHAV